MSYQLKNLKENQITQKGLQTFVIVSQKVPPDPLGWYRSHKVVPVGDLNPTLKEKYVQLCTQELRLPAFKYS